MEAKMKKQIEEMANDLENHTCMSQFQAEIASRMLYAKGYRKASEVADEIEKYILEGVQTIESENSDALYGAKFAIEKVVLPILGAFKKKYTEGEG